jgi:hypothetical protein
LPSMADDLVYASDPVLWAREVLGYHPDPWQAKVLRSRSKRIILNCSRQSGKSTTIAVLACHRAIFHPGSLILVISRSIRQSGELFIKFSQMINRLDPPPERTEDQKLSCAFQNGSRVISLPSSEETIVGYSAVSLLIEDEASRVPDDIWQATSPMLAVSNGQHILMSTPKGKRGHFYEIWEKGVGWEKIKITADQCTRISKEFLEEQLAEKGPLNFSQEYKCEFINDEFTVFTEELLEKMSKDNDNNDEVNIFDY